jgi:hypothetical protein
MFMIGYQVCCKRASLPLFTKSRSRAKSRSETKPAKKAVPLHGQTRRKDEYNLSVAQPRARSKGTGAAETEIKEGFLDPQLIARKVASVLGVSETVCPGTPDIMTSAMPA